MPVWIPALDVPIKKQSEITTATTKIQNPPLETILLE